MTKEKEFINCQNKLIILKRILKKQKLEKNKYEDLLISSLDELKFEKLRVKHFKSILYEIETLLKSNVNNEIIIKTIELWKNRDIIDVSIHNDLLFKNK